MAYVVGTLLIVLILVGLPLKYLAAEGGNPQQVGVWISTVLGTAHGFLYMVFLLAAAMLARRARFSLGFTVAMLLLGTVPIASFWAERIVTRRVRETVGVD